MYIVYMYLVCLDFSRCNKNMKQEIEAVTYMSPL